ncbi:MAG: OmpA family protein [Gammaproteobacteria bacterium]|nr:OmpA family protein [Gammaproteobacteria bacterium]MBT8135088.1 OmpA family protein [Gammaproteobacteria bacterium]NNJ50825.1 OmpA family protein [Gammaproteobacteria bacterium]
MSTVCAAEETETDGRSWYLGAGLGITELDPDTNNTGYSVSDERDTGFKLFGGYDYSDAITFEGFYADLGSAQLTSPFPSQPDGTVDYSTLGASVLWYFWRNGKNDGKDMRQGLQAYLHGGLSFLNNSSSVDYSQNNGAQVQYGVGLEYGLNNGIALRAGLDLYDKDAGMVFVGVLKRFGIKSKRKVVTEPEPVIEPVSEPVIETVATQVVVVPEVVVSYDVDTDKDGVVDRLDECADSPVGFAVDTKGCSIIEFNFGGVNFEPKSYELTDESKLILDEAAISINASPEIQKIEVQAHTDYKGSGEANLKLSEQRALSVRDYLVSQGVRENRLIAKGYGESQPIADNKTAEGRAKNRRVELKIISEEPAGSDLDEIEPDSADSADSEKPGPEVAP